MVSDSITNASIPCAPNVKDLGKKKRVNRLAKLKQCKLDARREQWLSQVKKKSGGSGGGEDWSGDDHGHGGSTGSAENEEMRASKAGNEETFHGSSLDSPSNSTVSFNSLLGSNDSGTNYSGSSSSSSSSSSGGCSSGNVTEEDEEGDDGCLDDWEAIADALAADDKSSSRPQHDDTEPVGRKDSTLDNPRMVSQMAPPPKVNPRAWRPDDAFRPQSLPNLTKNHSFPYSTGRHYANGGIPWGNRNLTVPTSCPICCEDLDLTDSSFMPCLCGFRLCLFCHKRILEQDCRCPGCRKPYDQDGHGGEVTVQEEGSLAFRLTRSYSMMARP